MRYILYPIDVNKNQKTLVTHRKNTEIDGWNWLESQTLVAVCAMRQRHLQEFSHGHQDDKPTKTTSLREKHARMQTKVIQMDADEDEASGKKQVIKRGRKCWMCCVAVRINES